MENVPPGFQPHFRKSPVTEPWEPLFSRRRDEALDLLFEVRSDHCNSRGFLHGGVVAALFGRNAVFLLNALSFLLSALLIRGMKFDEPHAQASAPLRLRDAIDLSPVLDGIRYVRKDRRLLTVVFAKAGELMIGPSWVLFTVMGSGYFHFHLPRIDPQRTAILGRGGSIGQIRHNGAVQ